MGKKRIIVEVHEDHYRGLLDRARRDGKTVANLVREALGLPTERQGVKGALSMPPRKKRGGKPANKTE